LFTQNKTVKYLINDNIRSATQVLKKMLYVRKNNKTIFVGICARPKNSIIFFVLLFSPEVVGLYLVLL